MKRQFTYKHEAMDADAPELNVIAQWIRSRIKFAHIPETVGPFGRGSKQTISEDPATIKRLIEDYAVNQTLSVIRCVYSKQKLEEIAKHIAAEK